MIVVPRARIHRRFVCRDKFSRAHETHGNIEHGTIRADDCGWPGRSCACTYACKVEQRPAPCCRASYCTDPVYTAATTTQNGDLATSTTIVVDTILPRFLLASRLFFPVLVSGTPSRTTRGCQHHLFPPFGVVVAVLFRSLTIVDMQAVDEVTYLGSPSTR